MNAAEAPTVEATVAALSAALDSAEDAARHYIVACARYQRALRGTDETHRECVARDYNASFARVAGHAANISELMARLHTARAHARMAGDL